MHLAAFGVRLLIGLALMLGSISFAPMTSSAQQDDNLSSIEVLKRLCPPEFTGPGYFEGCPDPREGVEFSLDGIDATTDADGSALFFNLREGTVTITENTIPATELAEYWVYCRLAEDPDAVVEFDYVDTGPTGAGIQIFLAAGTDLICGWYNIPGEPGTGRVELHKGLCPPNYTGDEHIQDCFNDNRQTGVQFNVDGRRGFTGEGGIVAFENLRERTYTITEPGAVLGHMEFHVSCARAEPAVPPMEFTYIEGGIELFVPEGNDIICHWSNIPSELIQTPTSTVVPTPALTPTATPETELSSVEVLKRLCPPGFTGPNFFEGCPEPRAGVEFSLDGLQTETNAAGSALFFELREGTYTITENTIPAGDLVDIWVYCRLAEDPDAVVEFNYVEAGPTGAGIELFVAADTDLICGWYNIPIEPTPTPTPTPTPVPPTPTPTPIPPIDLLDRHPVEIVEGDCQDLREVVFTLQDIELLENGEIGDPGPVPVAESFSTIDATIEDLTGEPHSIVVYLSPEDDDTAIACGQIGGVPREAPVDDTDATGGFAVKLHEVDDSGFIGIANLTPVDDEGGEADGIRFVIDEIDVEIFLTVTEPETAAEPAAA